MASSVIVAVNMAKMGRPMLVPLLVQLIRQLSVALTML
jgi:hypothetical protein